MSSNIINQNDIKKRIDLYFRWDTPTWSEALKSWNTYLYSAPKKCLELGAREGGLSLLLSDLGHVVVCSDLENPIALAQPNHAAHSLNPKNITYTNIDVLNIPFENEFDIIILKSVLGGVARDHNVDNAHKAAAQIHKALKPGGHILFVENLEGSKFHKLLRKKLRPWASYWHYFSEKEMQSIFKNYKHVDISCYGLLGMHTNNLFLKTFLKFFNKFMSKVTPKSWKYISYGVATK